jgi:hypothetical protein
MFVPQRVRLAALVTAVLTTAVLAVAGPAAAASSPTETKLAPASGKTAGGTRLDVYGSGFSHVKAVHFGAASGTSVKVLSSHELEVTAPAHKAGYVDVRVATSGGTSGTHTADHYTYVSPPKVTKVSPTSGETGGGTRVTITGTSFTHVTSVLFGSAAGTAIKVVKSSELQVTAPKHTAGTVRITVATSYGSSASVTADHYVYLGVWAPTTLPEPAGLLLGGLNGVSCPSTTACVAVGVAYDFGSGLYLPAAETLADGQWTATSPPLPAGTTGGNGVALQAVSCVSAGSCVAVGHDLSGSNNYSLPLVETLANGVWTPSTPSFPDAADGARSDTGLYGVSCSSTSACVAVGSDTAVLHGYALPLLETLSGGAWTPSTLPQPTGTEDGLLRGLSCVSATACTAVGYDTTGGPIADTLAGGTWKAAKPALPAGNTDGELLAVSCASATTCVATGAVEPTSVQFDPLVESLAGGVWKPTTPRLPGGDTLGALDGVSCTSATSCMATGYDDIAQNSNPYGNQFPLAEALSAGVWTPKNVPLLSGDGIGVLDGVSCPSSTVCHSAGDYYNSANDQTDLLDEVFDGSA